MKQTSKSSSNCRVTDLLSDDSDDTFSTSHVTVGRQCHELARLSFLSQTPKAAMCLIELRVSYYNQIKILIEKNIQTMPKAKMKAVGCK